MRRGRLCVLGAAVRASNRDAPRQCLVAAPQFPGRGDIGAEGWTTLLCLARQLPRKCGFAKTDCPSFRSGNAWTPNTLKSANFQQMLSPWIA